MNNKKSISIVKLIPIINKGAMVRNIGFEPMIEDSESSALPLGELRE